MIQKIINRCKSKKARLKEVDRLEEKMKAAIDAMHLMIAFVFNYCQRRYIINKRMNTDFE